MRISICILTKNCKTAVKKTLRSLKPFLRIGDEVLVLDTGSDDGTPALCRRLGARVIERPDLARPELMQRAREWCPQEFERCGDDPQFRGGFLASFAEARQILLEEAKHDYIFWIDADDTLQGGQKFREELETRDDGTSHTFFVRYDYAHDSADGVCTTVLWRERLVDRREWFWKGRCHEVLIPKEGLAAVQERLVRVQIPDVFIRHEPKYKKPAGVSDLRNYVILRTEYEENPANADPRTLYYLGNAARGLFRLPEAVRWYKAFIGISGSVDDRHNAALNVAMAYLVMGRPWQFLQWGFRAIQIKPFDARGFFTVARAYYELQQWQECLFWTEVGRQLPDSPQGLTSADPQQFNFYPAYFAAECHRKLGNIQGARAEAQKLAQLRPNLKEVAGYLQDTEGWAQRRDLAIAVGRTAQFARDQAAAIAITQQVKHPEILEEIGAGRLETEIHKDGKPDLAFLCGNTIEAWGPKSLITGIGGSERMVIEMSRRLAARGLAVTVYANVPHDQRGVDDHGVHWRHYTNFNCEIPRDYLVIWRTPVTLAMPVRAKKRYVWMHDVGDNRFWTPERIALADKVIVLSKWHRGCFPAIPDEKIYLSRNGIDNQLIVPTPRQTKKILYTSSPDRGLVQAINGFLVARDRDPELTLDILYGFTPYYYGVAAQRQYGFIVTQKRERHMVEFADEVMGIAEDVPGITYRGRISCEQVIKEMCGAGIWLYPAPFTEISCISAMEAQACGMALVASDVAALAETIDWKRPTTFRAQPDDSPERVAELILAAAAVPPGERRASAQKAQVRFNLDRLADYWMRDLFTEP